MRLTPLPAAQVIFIDELDALAPSRDSGHGGGKASSSSGSSCHGSFGAGGAIGCSRPRWSITSRVFGLRSSDEGIDVSDVARQYGGGGHAKAAGFKVPRDHDLAKS